MAANPPSVRALGGSIGRPRGPAGGPAGRIGTMGPGSRFDAQGMIAAAKFTDGDGDLMPNTFRFLNSVFDCIRYLEADMTRMETGQAVAALPAAASNQGTRTFVTDSSTSIFYDIVSGGGGIFVPVFSDGTNWRVG